MRRISDNVTNDCDERQRLSKSFSQLHVKSSRLFPSNFWNKDDWPKEYAGPRLPTLPYTIYNGSDSNFSK